MFPVIWNRSNSTIFLLEFHFIEGFCIHYDASVKHTISYQSKEKGISREDSESQMPT
jgi:hypothetical protein